MSSGKKLMRRNRPTNESVSLKNDDHDPDENNEGHAPRGRDIEMSQKNSNNVQEKVAAPRASGNANYRRPNNTTVLDSDLEDTPLLVDDIEGFLIGAGPSGDPYDGYYEGTRVHWEYQQDRRGGHLLFVENEETGELVPTDINGDMGHGHAHGGAGGDQQDYDDAAAMLLRGEDGKLSSHRPDIARGDDFSIMEKFFLASYVFFQGLLAGFCLALVYLVEQADSDDDLLLNYQPSSSEIRRILFIFGAISFVGALESFSDSWRRRRDATALLSSSGGRGVEGGGKESGKRTNAGSAGGSDSIVTQAQLEGCLLPLTWSALISFLILFILLLVMAPTDVLISQKNGYVGEEGAPADEWVVLAFQDNKFKTLFYRWKRLSLYRVGFAVLGWITACLAVMLRYLLSSKRDIAMNGMFEYVVTLRKKIASLQGDTFDPKMSVEDYHRLINIQKLGVQRSEAALRAKEENMVEDLSLRQQHAAV